MKSRWALLLLWLSVLVCAGCGGGGGGDNANTGNSTVAKAADYTGKWSGKIGTTTPVSISLTGSNTTNTVTGNIYSAILSGPFTGIVDVSNGNVTGTMANIVDDNNWLVEFAVAANTLSLTKAIRGSISLGTGTLSVTPTMAVDLTGLWTGSITEVDINDNSLIAGTSQNVTVGLAYNSTNNFVGAIKSANGLGGQITFKALSGSWTCLIEAQPTAWSPLIPAPTYGSIYTQSAISSTTSMQQAVASNPATPSTMQSIILSDEYDYVYNGVTYPGGGYKKYKLVLSR